MKGQFVLLILGFIYFEYFHLYNYEIILVGRILYVNTQFNHKSLLHQIIHCFVICFSCDILFRSLIYQYEDKDLSKLLNSIVFQLILTIIQWKYQWKVNCDIFYKLSQAKLQTWAFKKQYFLYHNLDHLFIYLMLAGIYQNILLGSYRIMILNILACGIAYTLLGYPELYLNSGITAMKNGQYLSQYVFYGFKLF